MARRRFYVHPIQKKYAIFIAAILVVYTFILATALFFSPAFETGAVFDLEGRWPAQNRFLLFLDQLWPALLISIPLFAVISILTTHRFAGPIHRLKLFLGQIGQGDLSPRLQFRSGDEFKELADLVNKILDQQRGLIMQMNQGQKELREALDRVASQGPVPSVLRESLEQVDRASQKMQKTLDQYNLIKNPS